MRRGARGGRAPRVVGPAGAPAQPIAVRVTQPSRRDLVRDTVQPATAEAFFEANLGAEVSGYVSELRVDIGARVKAGQTLARIAVPELIQVRNAAAADVATQRSAYDRTVELAAHNSITQRAVAEAKGRLDTALARQAEADAALEYAAIEAPFDGVVTLRTIDLGDIVYQASSPKGKARAAAARREGRRDPREDLRPGARLDLGGCRRRRDRDFRCAAGACVHEQGRARVGRARPDDSHDARRDRSPERRRR